MFRHEARVAHPALALIGQYQPSSVINRTSSREIMAYRTDPAKLKTSKYDRHRFADGELDQDGHQGRELRMFLLLKNNGFSPLNFV